MPLEDEPNVGNEPHGFARVGRVIGPSRTSNLSVECRAAKNRPIGSAKER